MGYHAAFFCALQKKQQPQRLHAPLYQEFPERKRLFPAFFAFLGKKNEKKAKITPFSRSLQVVNRKNSGDTVFFQRFTRSSHVWRYVLFQVWSHEKKHAVDTAKSHESVPTGMRQRMWRTSQMTRTKTEFPESRTWRAFVQDLATKQRVCRQFRNAVSFTLLTCAGVFHMRHMGHSQHQLNLLGGSPVESVRF